MKIYTEKIHAERLLKMLNRKNPCMYCPGQRNFKQKSGIPFSNEHEVCKICEGFIGCVKDRCPCDKYGEKEAIKRTWITLEEKGYI